jgi:hypothetical protein
VCAEATEGAVMPTSYGRGFLCEVCGVPRSDGSRRRCAQCHEATGGVEAVTSPWWKEPDGLLARVRGDAAIVREIVRGLDPAGGG